jgi:hypothetical protein
MGITTVQDIPDWLVAGIIAHCNCNGDTSPQELIGLCVDNESEWELLFRFCSWGRVEADGRDVFVIVPGKGLHMGRLWKAAETFATAMLCSVTKVFVEPQDGGPAELVFMFSMRRYIPA